MITQCRHTIYGVRCQRKATVQVGNQWFCSIHSPSYLDKQKQKRHERISTPQGQP